MSARAASRWLALGLSAASLLLAALPAAAWVDDPLNDGDTIKAQHVAELKNTIDAKRATPCSVGPFPWIELPGVAPNTLIRAAQIEELRTAIEQAYPPLGGPLATGNPINIVWTEDPVVPGMRIKTSHIRELRIAVDNAACCGDGVCNGTETCATCAADCGGTCGNGCCDGGETRCSCPADCPAEVCPDGCCGPTENCAICPLDCAGPCVCAPWTPAGCNVGGCAEPTPRLETRPASVGCPPTRCVAACDNDNICEPLRCETGLNCPDCPVCDSDGACEPSAGETCISCSGDCPPGCNNNGICNAATCETCASCPSDCPGPCCNNDTICGPGENCLTCPGDCPPPACDNDGICDPCETSSTCADCRDLWWCTGLASCVSGPACPNGKLCYGTQATCQATAVCNNNGVCNATACETCANCPGDCCPGCNNNGVCEPAAGETSCNCADCPGPCLCNNNGVCNAGETKCSCPSDCATDVCGDGCCTGSETASTCAADCPCTYGSWTNDGCNVGGCANPTPMHQIRTAPQLGCSPQSRCVANPVCGSCNNGVCDLGETKCTCPADCTADACGDGCCTGPETACTCPADCTGPCPCNSNGICNPAAGETCVTCPSDCPPSCNANGVCEPALCENPAICPGDCPCDSDGLCDPGETFCNCPSDCLGIRCPDGCCATSQGESNLNCPADCPCTYGTWTNVGCGLGGCTAPTLMQQTRAAPEPGCPAQFQCVADPVCVGCNNGICDLGETKCTCAADCAADVCGDGCRSGAETCDNGSSNGLCPAACSTSCTVNTCLQYYCTSSSAPCSSAASCPGGKTCYASQAACDATRATNCPPAGGECTGKPNGTFCGFIDCGTCRQTTGVCNLGSQEVGEWRSYSGRCSGGACVSCVDLGTCSPAVPLTCDYSTMCNVSYTCGTILSNPCNSQCGPGLNCLAGMVCTGPPDCACRCQASGSACGLSGSPYPCCAGLQCSNALSGFCCTPQGGSCNIFSNCCPGYTCSSPGGGTCQVACSPPNCDDGDPCTTDTCNAGTCQHPQINCDDGNPCTNDSCVSGACQHPPKCPIGQTCSGGVCASPCPAGQHWTGSCCKPDACGNNNCACAFWDGCWCPFTCPGGPVIAGTVQCDGSCAPNSACPCVPLDCTIACGGGGWVPGCSAGACSSTKIVSDGCTGTCCCCCNLFIGNCT